ARAGGPDAGASPAATPSASRDPAARRPAHRHPASPVAAVTRQAGAPRQSPYLFYDSVIPADVPAGQEIATYADGPHPTPVSAVAGRQVLWIDVTGSDTAAQVIDVEPGCATPAVAASWAYRKLSGQPGVTAIIYTTISEWAIVKADVSGLPASMQARLRWWIADPTGEPHLVPGSQATQWYWGPEYDISTAAADF
ncbi:MAG: hypothetical protein WAK71_05915, partial [Streptosporangiaceae bacterium]